MGLWLNIGHGTGIPDDKVDHVFQRFTQTDASCTRQYEGAGLGLASVKRLMQTMGGDIAVDSTEGQGTAVYLRLHLSLAVAVAEERLESATRGEVQAHDPDRPLRILAAEDERSGQIAIQAMLERQGHKVAIASDGHEVLEALADGEFDCILMDIQMPGVNGVEATEQIRADEKRSGGRPVWIIALTAYALAGDREKFLEAGMDDYVSKPVQEQALTEALQRALAVSASRAVLRS